MTYTDEARVFDLATEEKRLSALRQYEILDTPPEQSFDRITRLARAVFDAPVALITLVDRDRLWFKSKLGLNLAELPREKSFCNETIRHNGHFIVRDAEHDVRFRKFPLVSGDAHIRFYAGIPLQTPDGFNIGTLSVMDREPRDILPSQTELLDDLARITIDELELRQLASADSLTGALNRRTFIAEAERETARSARYGNPLSFIMFDLDHCGEINQRYGYPTGDSVLRALIATCRAQLRATDYLGRMGGQHFAICMPETFHDHATIVAERLRQAMNINFSAGNAVFPVSASFGVSTWRGGETDTSSALARAEEALQAAKVRGRNQVASI